LFKIVNNAFMEEQKINTLWTHLHWLSVLAQQGSYTAAAARLGVSKAAMSQRIAELERAAKVTLVQRTTRSLRLTEAGQRLVDETRASFEQIEQSFAQVRDLAEQPSGLLRVTAPVALGRQHLAPCVAAFLKSYPDIHIELELTDRFVNLANEGFDLAVRHTNTPPETHVAWVLCETRSVLLASPAYLAARGVPAHPAELAAHDCLLYLGGASAASGSWTFARNAPAKVRGRKAPSDAQERVGVNVRGCLKANNSEVLREALLAGLGIGLLPDFSVPPPGADGQPALVPVLPDWQAQGFFGERIYALRPWSAQVPMAVQCLVEFLRAHFAPGFAKG
jgi:DNA-binding transcriptional LysR family regulator